MEFRRPLGTKRTIPERHCTSGPKIASGLGDAGHSLSDYDGSRICGKSSIRFVPESALVRCFMEVLEPPFLRLPFEDLHYPRLPAPARFRDLTKNSLWLQSEAKSGVMHGRKGPRELLIVGSVGEQ
jgi:hypothetical protein